MLTLSANGFLVHSAKGSTWNTHKYLKKIDGDYYYPSGYTKGRTIDSLKDDKTEERSTSSSSGPLSALKASPISGTTHATSKAESKKQTTSSSSGPLSALKASPISETTETDKLSKEEVEEMALRTIRGEFGNGQVRKDLLAGNYQEIQDRVNELMKALNAKQASISKTSSEVVEKGSTAMESATKKVSDTKITTASKGIDMEQVQSVYRKKRT